MYARLLVAAAALALAAAECPNACSGHGDCSRADQCECYDGFGGGDCSLRVCPAGNAFVDAPRGDLNHDGQIGYGDDATVSYSQVQWSRYKQFEAWPVLDKTTTNFPSYGTEADMDPTSKDMVGGWAAQVGEGHFVVECSGKGICDRTVGACKCFDGYVGSACQRTACPNDCSGHGSCRTIGEIARKALSKTFKDSVGGINFYTGITTPYDYRLWDADSNTACVCDVGYSGIDCSLRDCPRGDDPLTFTDSTCGGGDCRDEEQAFSVDGNQDAATYFLIFRDFDGKAYKTQEFTLDTKTGSGANTDNANAVKDALLGLANNIAGDVSVIASGGGAAGSNQVRVVVTFSGKSGNLPEMTLGWEGTSNKLTAHAYVFQPFQPVQQFTFDLAALTSGSQWYFRVIPQDSTLFGKAEYHETTYTLTAAAATESDVSDFVAAALNQIPAVKFARGTYFARDLNVLSVDDSGTVTVTVAFPDKNFGSNAVMYGAASAAPVAADVSGSHVVDGNREHSECSNRGLCDHSSGLCKCFSGYTGDACSIQSTLAF